MSNASQNVLIGSIFAGGGILFGLGSLSMPLGTTFQMGPGYFPLVLSIILVGLGVIRIIARNAGEPDGETIALPQVPWRGAMLVSLGPIVFALTVGGLGFAPATFLLGLISGLSSRRMSIRLALITAAALTVVCILIFNYGLGLSYNLWGSWLGF